MLLQHTSEGTEHSHSLGSNDKRLEGLVIRMSLFFNISVGRSIEAYIIIRPSFNWNFRIKAFPHEHQTEAGEFRMSQRF